MADATGQRIQVIKTDKAGPPVGPYSQGIKAGGFVFVAGEKGLDPASYTVRTVPALVKKLKAWEDYCDGERPLANAIKRLGKV